MKKTKKLCLTASRRKLLVEKQQKTAAGKSDGTEQDIHFSYNDIDL